MYKDIRKQRQARREWYQRNKRKEMDQHNLKYARTRQILNRLKQMKGCIYCNENNYLCLEFDHIDPTTKSFNIATGLKAVSKTRLKQEIQKCQVVCSNCHRKKTFQDFNYDGTRAKRKTNIFIHRLKQESCCAKCKETFVFALDFHHLDPKSKIDSVSEMLQQHKPISQILEEIKKCILLCSNCHKKGHRN